jgi:hypothetical protein
MTTWETCDKCKGAGETAFCHNECDDPSGCGDCVDECHWCLGFGRLYPAAFFILNDWDDCRRDKH